MYILFSFSGDCVYSPRLWIHQVESWGSNIAVNVWWFSDINNLVKVENCNREYDRTLTFDTIQFHRTTEISDNDDNERDTIIHALRHGISRLIFKTSKSESVGIKQFTAIMTRNQRLDPDLMHIVTSIFVALDANRNKKLEVADLRIELSEKKSDTLMRSGTEWMSYARMFNYPLPVDFSNDSYITIKPFLWSEVVGEHNEDDEEDNVDDKEKEPQKDSDVKTGVKDHDEL